MIKLESLSNEYLIGIINAMALKFSDEVDATPEELIDEAYIISNGLNKNLSDADRDLLKKERDNLELLSQTRWLTVAETSRIDELDLQLKR